MKDYIINSFILKDKNTAIDIHNYIRVRYDDSIEINVIQAELKALIKKQIVFFHIEYYIL